ncbi:helix-hairpin-helix domain-containing protein [Tepidibacillus infernus]|uniref:helix-hairpin-helix domain-containing protein n=1 Tax=Tepidibacillus TaxID=1494427 RepID=UPI000853EF51|nr:helix-hairpin-helix domain-containing protein [Tepidibacillus sp. HK-1]GBF10108.1 ComE operon protein 1 [Tepidibacillus sp. HK-1]
MGSLPNIRFTKREKVLLGLLIIFLLIIISQYISYHQKQPPTFADEPLVELSTEKGDTPQGEVKQTEMTNPKKIVVDVKGAVAKPGIYQLTEGSRVKEALDLAGGTLANADLNQVNLAQKIADEMVIFVPVQGETLNGVSSGLGVSFESNAETISINQASEEELMQLDGIGPAKAKAIIEYRTKQGKFQTIEDLMNVPGIGQKTFEQIKEKISVH